MVPAISKIVTTETTLIVTNTSSFTPRRSLLELLGWWSTFILACLSPGSMLVMGCLLSAVVDKDRVVVEVGIVVVAVDNAVVVGVIFLTAVIVLIVVIIFTAVVVLTVVVVVETLLEVIRTTPTHT
jgi:hypothetical protein